MVFHRWRRGLVVLGLRYPDGCYKRRDHLTGECAEHIVGPGLRTPRQTVAKRRSERADPSKSSSHTKIEQLPSFT